MGLKFGDKVYDGTLVLVAGVVIRVTTRHWSTVSDDITYVEVVWPVPNNRHRTYKEKELQLTLDQAIAVRDKYKIKLLEEECERHRLALAKINDL